MRYEEDDKRKSYIKVKDGDSEAMVRERCLEQAYRLLESLPEELRQISDWLTPWLELLDQNAREQARNRTRAMLLRLDYLIDSGVIEPARLQELHRVTWSPDRRTASTPVLLAIAALLYSHIKWTEPHFHDVHSALELEGYLRGRREPEPYPQWIVARLPLLIALQNVYRTCSTNGRKEVGEVAIYQDRALNFDSSKLTQAIARILRSNCTAAEATVAADALLLIAAAYEGRYGNPVDFQAFEEFTGLVKQAINEPEANGGTLVIFEFRRHLFPDPEDDEILERILNQRLPENSPAQVLWISFDRFWAIGYSDSLKAWLEEISKTSPGQLQTLLQPAGVELGTELAASCLNVFGKTEFLALKLDADNAFRVAFNCPPQQPRCLRVPDNVWGRIEEAMSLFQEHRRQSGHDSLIPWAYVMRVLYVMQHIYPQDFLKLEVFRPNSPIELGEANSIMLPRQVPSPEEIEEAATAQDWQDSKLIVARCLATLLLNQRMAFGNKQQIVKVDKSDRELQGLRRQWLELAHWIAIHNQHSALERYLQVFLTPKVQLETEILFHLPEPAPRKSLVAGIDIGASGIKAALYEYDVKTETLGERLGETLELKTEMEQQYADTKSFVERLDAELTEKWEREWKEKFTAQKDGGQEPASGSKTWKDHLMAIGVTWPGAVAGEPGHQYIAAYSKAIGYFQPFNRHCFFDEKATADNIHQFLNLREALEQHFPQIPVMLINDGVAHVMYHQWQFNREVLSQGETIVGLFAGTGSAEAVFSGDTGLPLDVMAELGKQIDDISCPFPPARNSSFEEYPAGISRNIFNKDTVPAIAEQLLKEGNVSSPSLSPVPGLLLGWILEEVDALEKMQQLGATGLNDPRSNSAIRQQLVQQWQKLEQLWEKERPAGGKSLAECLEALEADLNSSSCPQKKLEGFAKEVARRAGLRLADLIAQVRELYNSKNVFAGGGPMTGATGRWIRRFARQELRQQYGFDVIGDEKPQYNPASLKHHLARLLRLPEPRIAIEPPGPSGSRGAAIMAVTLLAKKPIVTSPLSFSAFSVLELGQQVQGRVYFPRRSHLPSQTAGYVRSRLSASKSYQVLQTREKLVYHPLPWRDYPEAALTPLSELLEQIKNQDEPTRPRRHFIISARNTINEWKYQVRLREGTGVDRWYRRLDDNDVDSHWPVIVVNEEKICLLPFHEAKEKQADLVTGIPLVIAGKPVSRTFLITNCSDVAHNFEVDPQGRLGSAATVWQELSECWQRAKDEKVPDYVIEQRMDKIADHYKISTGRNLLHSVIAQRENGSLIALAVTGALTDIAKEIATNWQAVHAVLLDNGGSVGWTTLIEQQETLLVAGPNYRPRGLVFIDLWLRDFPHPRQHPALLRKIGGS